MGKDQDGTAQMVAMGIGKVEQLAVLYWHLFQTGAVVLREKILLFGFPTDEI